MSSKPADVKAIFDGITQIVFQDVTEGFNRELAAQADAVYQAAKLITQKTFKVLTAGGDGSYLRVTAPNANLKTSWPALSDKWNDYKAKRLSTSKGMFYYGISPRLKETKGKSPSAHLKQQMSGRSAGALFGLPKVRIKQGTSTEQVFNIEGKPTQTTGSGQTKFTKGTYRPAREGDKAVKALPGRDGMYRWLGGQFVALRAEISVELFPRLKNITPSEVFARMMKEEGAKKNGNGWLVKLRSNEFGSPKFKIPSRPLLVPFLQWYVDQYAVDELDKYSSK